MMFKRVTLSIVVIVSILTGLLFSNLAPAYAALCTGTGGVWSNPAAWDCGFVPNPSDDVLITGVQMVIGSGETITRTGSTVIGNFVLNGTVVNDGTFTVTWTFSFGGTIINNNNLQVDYDFFSGGTIVNYGTINFTVPFSNEGTIINCGTITGTVTGNAPQSCPTTPPTVVPPKPTAKPLFTDGRCNQQADQPVTIYSDRKGGFYFYAVHESVGHFALHLTKADLEANPDTGENYLIGEAVGVQVYRLKGGKLQVKRLLPDGKVYDFIWPPCH